LKGICQIPKTVRPHLHDAAGCSTVAVKPHKQLNNWLDNRLNVCIHNTASCSTGCQNGWTTCWTTGCIVYTNIQPVKNRLYYV